MTRAERVWDRRWQAIDRVLYPPWEAIKVALGPVVPAALVGVWVYCLVLAIHG